MTKDLPLLLELSDQAKKAMHLEISTDMKFPQIIRTHKCFVGQLQTHKMSFYRSVEGNSVKF